MKNKITSCIWFNGNAGEAADFYIDVFKHGEKTNQDLPIVSLNVFSTDLLFLNGGPSYAPTPAFSFFLYCGSHEEAERIFNLLAIGGNIMIPMGSYEWAEKYGWVTDKYGISWQIDGDDIRVEEKICPALLFVNEKSNRVKEAREFYLSVFGTSQMLMEMPADVHHGLEPGSLLFTQIKLMQSVVNLMAGPGNHDFDFTSGNSFVVSCDTQEEIDYYWNQLGYDGRYDMCGWLTDKFGVSWQIVPRELSVWLSDSVHGKSATERMLKMKKLIISDLINN
jgi:predicted 3-demethylubiquinone-9 3-methyltransferase (glyoxalase superfamily)